MQTSSNSLFEYAAKNSLTIHPGKCKLLIFSRTKVSGPINTIKFRDKHAEVVDSAKCLGVVIDSKLSWEAHLQSQCKALSLKLKKLYQIRSMPSIILETIYTRGILPSVTYGILI